MRHSAVKVGAEEAAVWHNRISPLEVHRLEKGARDPALHAWVVGLGAKLVVQPAPETVLGSDGVGLAAELCIFFASVGKMANAIEEVVDCLVKVDQRVPG